MALTRGCIGRYRYVLAAMALLASGWGGLTGCQSTPPPNLGESGFASIFGPSIADLINGAINNSMPVYEMGPSATAIEKKMIEWALGKIGWQTSGAGVMTHGGSMANLTCLLAADNFSKAATSISTLKCPLFPKMAPSFISLKCADVKTSLSPVAVKKMSPILAARGIGITSKPSMAA